MDDPFDMSGQVVLVTGGTKGVGRGIAEAFLARGADVVICGRNEPDQPVAVDGRHARFVVCDVRDVDQVQALVAEAARPSGHLDVVINNAGGTPPAFVQGTSPRFLTSVITLNLVAPLYVSQAANDIMQAQDRPGSIVNIASVSALSPSPGVAAYGAAKAGLIHLTQSLAVEFAPRVRVNTVTAGIVGTDEIYASHYGNDEARIARLTAGVPTGRMATPDDVAGACLYLCSPVASHVTGANIVVHGGGDPPGALPERG